MLKKLGWVALLVALAGCGMARTPMRVWGKVAYDGKPVAKGSIVFVPVEDTLGPTTGANIEKERYEVPASIGPWRDGDYKIEITGMAKNGQKLPNPSIPGGPPVELEDNFIPTKYNNLTELRVSISADSNKNEFAFVLPR